MNRCFGGGDPPGGCSTGPEDVRPDGSGSEGSPCAECGAVRCAGEAFTVDGKVVCHTCLFGEVPPVQVYPIGVVVNGQSRGRSDFGLSGKGRQSRIELHPGQQRFMYKLVDYPRRTGEGFIYSS